MLRGETAFCLGNTSDHFGLGYSGCEMSDESGEWLLGASCRHREAECSGLSLAYLS